MNNAPLSLWFPVLPPQLADDGRTEDGGEGRQRFLRSERENDFSETGGRDGRNRRFLIRPPPVAENAVSYRQKRRRDGRTESHGNGTRRGKMLFIRGRQCHRSNRFLPLRHRYRRRQKTAAGPIVTAPRQTHPA